MSIYFYCFKFQLIKILLVYSNKLILLALLPIGPLSLSISSNFCSCVFTWSCSARTELLQKGVLLVRIRTSMDRISICFFEPGDLRFRPDSGQMEDDLDVLQLALSNLIIYTNSSGLGTENYLLNRWLNNKENAIYSRTSLTAKEPLTIVAAR